MLASGLLSDYPMCEVANANTNTDAVVKGDVRGEKRVGNCGEQTLQLPIPEIWNINSVIKLLYTAPL